MLLPLASSQATPVSLDWFYVSPPETFGAWVPAPDTGSYRLSDDILLRDAEQVGHSAADLARAVLDEIEQPKYRRRRFHAAPGLAQPRASPTRCGRDDGCADRARPMPFPWNLSRSRPRLRPSIEPASRLLEDVDLMGHVQRFDHIGITVADLASVTAFFVGLGLEEEGTGSVEGEFVETVCGIPGARCEIAMLRPPDGGSRLELSSFVTPDHVPGSPTAMANELGLRNVSFEVDNLEAVVNELATDGYGLVGGIGEYENSVRMAYVRGPEGIIVSLFEQIG
jgi:catechol 2,3-dioxygenase-like lactoylglutathione lyase family enzyme